MTRAPMDPPTAYGRHPLQPHQLVDRVTRVEDAIVLCHLGVARLDAHTWSLAIDGLVRRPRRLAFDDLMRRPQVEITAVHECCGSPLEPELPKRRVCTVAWTGVRLADLIAECDPDPAARFVWAAGADHGVFQGVSCDAFVKDLPIERVAADALVAVAMNGEALRPEHGYPARLVVPGWYGTNSVKWLARLTLADSRASGPFTTRWYNDPVRDAAGRPTGAAAPVWSIAPESVIVSPAPGESVAAGTPVALWGWAWADGGVSAVVVSDDSGATWMQAAVEPAGDASGRWAWQRFTLAWTPSARGQIVLSSRASTADGRSQPPSGARNAIHTVTIEVR